MRWRRHRSLKEKLEIQARRYKHRWWRRIGGSILGVIIVFGGGFTAYSWVTKPKLNTVFVSNSKARLFNNEVNVRYLADDGKCFYQTDDETYSPVGVNQIKRSHNLVNALTAIEDRDFFKETGVNYPHTVKAALETFTGHGVSGGSTITQQLIKLTFYSTTKKDQTIKRKGQEIILAEQLNHRFSKYRILAWYFDKANFGNGQQGIVAASKYYYGRRPEQLSVLEAATLVGIVNSPTTYNPYLKPESTLYRRNLVLRSMHEAGHLSKSRMQELQSQPLTKNLKFAKQNAQGELQLRQAKLGYNGFVSAVNAQLNRYDNRLIRSSVTIKTTMNRQLQDQVNQIVNKQKYPDDKLQEAIVVMDNRTGAVKAISGGRDQTVLGGYNRAFNVKRSSGSSIKPLLDYGPGFDLFHWTASTMAEDTPYKYPGTNQVLNDWDNQHQGLITLRQVLVQSRNIPAVKALVQVNLTRGKQALTSLGLPSQNLYYANAIGLDTSPLALASGYTALANGGQRSNARFVTSIDNGAKVLRTKRVSEQVYSPQTAYLLTRILEGVFVGSGTATRAKIDGISQAGKPGTVGRDDKPDALTDGWMVGYTKSYTVAVWVGYDNPYDKKNYLTNAKANVGQDLYKQVMQATTKLPGNDHSQWDAPQGVSGQAFARGINTTTDNFLISKNRQHSYVPFYLNMSPQDFLDVNHRTKNDQSVLAQLYDYVNQDDH